MRFCLIGKQLSLLPLTLVSICGQSLFEQAPPAVDAALRDRIRLFYQAQVDGRWEEAAKWVSADSRELFGKNRGVVKKFEVTSITWSPGFMEAKVVADLDVAHPQGLIFPEASFWRLEKGQWLWWVPAEYRKKGKR